MNPNNAAIPDIDLMRQSAAKVARLLSTLSHEDRLLLLCQISQGEQSVSELEAQLGIHQPSLSQQLGVLRSEALVLARREGTRMFYSISDEKIRQLLQTLYQLYCAAPATLTYGQKQ